MNRFRLILITSLLAISVYQCKRKHTAASVFKNHMAVSSANVHVNNLPLSFSVTADTGLSFVPAIHSFASAYYNGLWVFIGGKKNGFHGKSNNPPPFRVTTVNDSIWVVDFVNRKSWGVPVPGNYLYQLACTNPAFCQDNQLLYLCGGFTATDSTTRVLNTTSSWFMGLNLSNLVQYVQSGGNGSPFSNVISFTINSPYVQVAGGDMLLTNNNFYLIGGQNYNTAYSAGQNGIYTNAIRKFSIAQQNNGTWTLTDTMTVTDLSNLHRRDMNLVPYWVNGRLQATLYGGVFTPTDEAYLNPINISGLGSGQPAYNVEVSKQMINQYTCSHATMSFNNMPLALTVFFGGITYQEYNMQTGKLQVGDHGVPMPFSNLISMMIRYRNLPSPEYVQLPPNYPLLPGYIGSNAQFIPLPQYVLNGHTETLDGDQILNAYQGQPLLIGYLFGGIVSMGPTSGTTANGYIATYANPKLYGVYLNLNDEQQIKN